MDCPAAPLTHLPARTVEGPTNVKFQEQDSKIETLSRRFEDLEKKIGTDTHNMRVEVEGAFKKQQDVINQMGHNIDERFKRQDSETQSKFTALQTSIDSGRKAQR